MRDDNRPHGDLISVFHPPTQVEAQSFAVFLQDRGIRAMVSDNSAIQVPVSFFVGSAFALAPQVLVNRDDREKAEGLIPEFEALTRRADEIEPDPKDELEVRKSWADWPRCPECSARRTVQCTDCGEMGDDFSLAEYQDEEGAAEPERPKKRSEDDEQDEIDSEAEEAAKETTMASRRPFVICPACAHSFRPVFLRLCAGCDHVFDDGRYPTPVGKKKPQSLVVFFIGVALFLIACTALYLVYGPKHASNRAVPPPEMPRF